MTNTYREMLVEVSELFKYIPEELVNKIPKQLIIFIDNNKSAYYKYTYDTSIPFAKHTFKRETLAFLGFLNLNYWTEDKKSKEELETLFQLNNDSIEPTKKYKENLFDRKNSSNDINSSISENLPAEVRTDSLINKIINSIKKFFTKR